MTKGNFNFKIRNLEVQDIKEVYKLLTANRPYVGLNSRYTYFLLAKDFSDTCVVAEYKDKIVGFSSGYISPSHKDTFFSWETVVQEDFRGNNLQKLMLLHQIESKRVKFFEGTVNPSNEASKRTFRGLAQLLETKCEECMLFSGDDFENDGHEPEILFRVGPFSQERVNRTKLIFEKYDASLERLMFMHLDDNDCHLECEKSRKTYIASSKLKMSHTLGNMELTC
jgi:L-2,4-diaminobutyric acid acetyltransferase